MKSFLIFPFFLLLTLATGCGEGFFNQIVEIDIPEHEPVLAVSAHFKAQDSTLTVFVSHSAGILDPVILDTVVVSGAAIEVLRDGAPWQTVPSVAEGHYHQVLGEVIGSDLHTYTLKVSVPGYEPVEAYQTMPERVDILQAEYQAQGGINSNGDKVNTLSVEFQDPAGADNYYLLEAFVHIQDTLQESFDYNLYLDSEDVLVEYHNGGLLFKDGPINGKKYTLKAYFPDNIHEFPGSALTVRLHSISRDRYLFLRTLDLYDSAQDNPFAEPVVVHDNIENGVGIFMVEAMAERVLSF
ncbi:MAG: DUF4249 domain-containing protein [Lewinellaceae bacterium]|nr:DUF4249 domain-containing protein [Lewinellaceae bacterium]